MRVMTVDWSFSKSGVAIFELEKDKFEIVHIELIKTDAEEDHLERIDYSVKELMKLYRKYAVDLIIKEGAIVGQSSTGLPVIKSHGALEYYCYSNLIPFEDMHNATMKAYARRELLETYNMSEDEVKKLNKKKIVEKFIELWYNGIIPELYGPRGGYIDDLGDAVLIGIIYYTNTKGD